MARPTNEFGYDKPWVSNPDGTTVSGMSVYDTPIGNLPPLTAALRTAWAGSAHPVPSSAAMAAIFAAVHNLEQRVTALEP